MHFTFTRQARPSDFESEPLPHDRFNPVLAWLARPGDRIPTFFTELELLAVEEFEQLDLVITAVSYNDQGFTIDAADRAGVVFIRTFGDPTDRLMLETRFLESETHDVRAL